MSIVLIPIAFGRDEKDRHIPVISQETCLHLNDYAYTLMSRSGLIFTSPLSLTLEGRSVISMLFIGVSACKRICIEPGLITH